MRAPALPRLLSVSLLTSLAAAQTWEPVASLPASATGRQHAAGVAVGDALYAIGGEPFSTNGDSDGAVHRYSVAANQWVALEPLNGPVIHQGAGLDPAGRLIVFGGVDALDPGGDPGETYVYDGVNGITTGLADRSAQAPDGLFAWASDDSRRLYSIGGGRGATATPSNQNKARVERYDAASDTWEVLAPLLTPVADAAAVNDGQGHLLVCGGFVEHGGARSTNVASYDVLGDAWSDTEVPDMPVGLNGARALRGVDGRIYVLGGESDSGVEARVWVLDADHTFWSQGPDMLTPRKHFAAALGADDALYAIGGTTSATGVAPTAGTALVERLSTIRCPELALSAAVCWEGQAVSLAATVTGGAPQSYQWHKDGVALLGNVASGGGALSGTTTRTLTIAPVSGLDSGEYTLVATNTCGAVSVGAPLRVRSSPTFRGAWAVQVLHPAGAIESRAYGVDGLRVVGSARYPHPTYNSLEHPMLWDASTGVASDLTPANSVGGGCLALSGEMLVGWYWWPYWTQFGTGYYAHACRWLNGLPTVVDLQPQGYEIGRALATDGVDVAGYVLYEETSIASQPIHWPSGAGTGQVLAFPAASGGNLTAVFRGQQYGILFVSPAPQATQWRGLGGPIESLQPLGVQRSAVLGAGWGQQVGTARVAGVDHASVWGGSPDSLVDLHPTGASSSAAHATCDGLQVGEVVVGTETRATLWRGTAGSALDLHAELVALRPEFTRSFATAIDVPLRGKVRVAGNAYNAQAGRYEAVVWACRRFYPASATSR
ncbi:MAG: immunoglobulin domain-containing protein [Planctomycetota bacterium]